MVVSYDRLLARQFRRRPFMNDCGILRSQPRNDYTFEMRASLPDFADKVHAWVVFPNTIIYADGTKWQDRGACELTVLSPVQMEMSAD
jgi:hypothetical protein